jgi:hypothetical protein
MRHASARQPRPLEPQAKPMQMMIPVAAPGKLPLARRAGVEADQVEGGNAFEAPSAERISLSVVWLERTAVEGHSNCSR